MVVSRGETEGQPAGHLDHGPTNGAVRTLALTMVFQALRPPAMVYSENKLSYKGGQSLE